MLERKEVSKTKGKGKRKRKDEEMGIQKRNMINEEREK